MLLQTNQFINGKWSSKFPDWDSENTLILIFAAPKFIHDIAPIHDVISRYPHSKIIGCSSAGEICGSHIFDNSIALAIAKFERTKLKSVNVGNQSADDSYETGKKLVQELLGPNLRGVFILSEGLNVNGSELVKGLNTIDKPNVVITGGLAGDGDRFKQTWGIYQDKIKEHLVTGVGFYGDHIHLGHGSRGGWDIFGPERHITRATKNILYELDGRPALKLYKEYLGDRAKDLPASGLLYPLAIRKDSNDTRHLVRTILSVNEEEQSLTFAGDVPNGYLAQLMHANFDRLITAADEAGSLASEELNVANQKGSPVLAIAVSCVGRRLLLGERSEEETESTINSLPAGTKQIGFYSYGEISPYTVGNCDLHNQTMTLTTLYEDVD